MYLAIASNFFGFLCLSLFFTLLILCVCSVPNLYAISPSFSSQEIIEPPYSDWQIDPQTRSLCPLTTNASIQQHAHSPDIAAVSYYSDGNTLNATLLLSHPLKDVSSYVAYHMIIQPSYVYDANGKASGIYADTIYSENSTAKWSRWIYEKYPDGLFRTVYKKDSYTGFFDEKKESISFSLDLNTISSPNQYLLSFDAQDGFYMNDKWCNLIDTTNWFPIPQPEYTITSSPSSITLRPGEERNVELRITSPIQRNGVSHVILSPEPANDLEINLKPPLISIPPVGSNVSIIHIKAQENTKYEQLPFTHTITINAVITIPDFTLYGATFSEVKSNSLTENISKGFSNLTITVLPPMTFHEQFSAFWNTYGSLVSLVGGGFAAGFAALVFNRLAKTKQDTQRP